MELINHTNFPALLYRNSIAEDRIAAAVIVRVTYALKPFKAVPSDQQAWPLEQGPWMTEYGPMDSDLVFRRGGVDIFVFGKARAPFGKPVESMEVSVQLQDKELNKLKVWGDRVWEKKGGELVIGKPQPFLEMPLTLAQAYGGKAQWDGLEVPYGNNPYGKGYIWEREEAPDHPLPNVEDPAQSVHAWDHRPDPVGLVGCPISELRMRGNVDFDEAGEMTRLGPRFFNSAFPAMIVPQVQPGDKLVVNGMTANGTFSFMIPDHPFRVRINQGEKSSERPLFIDQVGLEPDKLQAFITYRFPFQYVIQPLQKRSCELFTLQKTEL